MELTSSFFLRGTNKTSTARNDATRPMIPLLSSRTRSCCNVAAVPSCTYTSVRQLSRPRLPANRSEPLLLRVYSLFFSLSAGKTNRSKNTITTDRVGTATHLLGTAMGYKRRLFLEKKKTLLCNLFSVTGLRKIRYQLPLLLRTVRTSSMSPQRSN